MRSPNVIFASFLVLTLILGAIGSFAQVKGQSSGFVQYKVEFSSRENSTLQVFAVINESVQPTNQVGLIDLTLGISFDSFSFAYSKDVNSSSLPEVFPYLPTVTNQSLSYAFHGCTAAGKLDNVGQARAKLYHKRLFGCDLRSHRERNLQNCADLSSHFASKLTSNSVCITEAAA